MRLNVAYNRVGEEAAITRHAPPQTEAIMTPDSVPNDSAEVNESMEETTMTGKANGEHNHGRRPDCRGKVTVNEGDAW